MVYASGPLCSEQSCEYWGRCCHNSVKKKKLRTPEWMTEEMKRFFEATRQGKVKFVCGVLEKIESQGGFADPSELREYRRDEEIKLRGWVIKRTSTERAENITLCHGLGPCNLAFWREREVFEQVGDVSEGDILWIEGDYSGSMCVRLSNPPIHQPLSFDIRIASLAEVNVVQSEHIEFQPHTLEYFR